MRMVSLSVSPLVELVVDASWKPMTRPPSLLTDVSKLSRVRVEGSKKSVATTRPRRRSRFGRASNRAALPMMRRMSAFVH